MKIDMNDLKMKRKRVGGIYQCLSAYFTFMCTDGNIEKPTYDMLQKDLDSFWNEWEELYYFCEGYVEPSEEQKNIDRNIKIVKQNIQDINDILNDTLDETDIQRIKSHCNDSQEKLDTLKDEIEFQCFSGQI